MSLSIFLARVAIASKPWLQSEQYEKCKLCLKLNRTWGLPEYISQSSTIITFSLSLSLFPSLFSYGVIRVEKRWGDKRYYPQICLPCTVFLLYLQITWKRFCSVPILYCIPDLPQRRMFYCATLWLRLDAWLKMISCLCTSEDSLS